MTSASDSRLLQSITQMMTDPTQAQNETRIESIMTEIRLLKVKKTSEQLRLASCHFMTMYHTRKAMTIGADGQQPNHMGGMAAVTGGGPADPINMQAVEKFKIAQRKDMELGWDLLNIKGSNTQAARTARVLKIEVAQRLEDSLKLKEAFDDLMSRALTEEENMVAFTAAPFLGDWKTMMRLGKRIEKVPGGMEQLHLMSLQLPIPDFTLVYALCKEHKLQKTPAPEASTLIWQLCNVARIRVKFRDVNCGKYEAKRQELLAEINKQGAVQWEDVPTISHVHVKRMGALCQAVSFGEIPMMLNGPHLEGRIHVRGRAEMPLMSEQEQMAAAQGNPYGMPDPRTITMLIQEEEWDLMQDENDENIYKGIYSLKQRPQLPDPSKMTSEHAPVNMSFDCEVHLGETQFSECNNGKTKGKGKSKTKGNSDNDSNSNSNNSNANSSDSKNADDDEQMAPDEEDGERAAEEAPLITEFDGLELD